MNYKNLFFSGGGCITSCFLGILLYISKNAYYIFKNINTVTGTSFGSIYALLIILEIYDIKKLIKYLLTQEISFFKNVIKKTKKKNLFGNNILDLNYEDFLTKIIEHFDINIDIRKVTFKELYNKYDKKLCIRVTNITDKKPELFSVDNKPDLKVIEAIKMSSSIPYLFDIYEHGGKFYIDGCATQMFNNDNIKTDDTLILRTEVGERFENSKNILTSIYEMLSQWSADTYLINSINHQVIKIPFEKLKCDIFPESDDFIPNMINDIIVGYEYAESFFKKNS